MSACARIKIYANASKSIFVAEYILLLRFFNGKRGLRADVEDTPCIAVYRGKELKYRVLYIGHITLRLAVISVNRRPMDQLDNTIGGPNCINESAHVCVRVKRVNE